MERELGIAARPPAASSARPGKGSAKLPWLWGVTQKLM